MCVQWCACRRQYAETLTWAKYPADMTCCAHVGTGPTWQNAQVRNSLRLAYMRLAPPASYFPCPAVGRAAGCTRAKAAGEAAATLVGVFPAQWAAWTAPEQAAHLRAHALGRRLLVSLCAEQGSLQVAGLRRLDE